jgi:hypothetical protein
MFIIAQAGATYGRLKFNTGPGGALRVATSVDWSQPFPATDHAAWEEEYRRCVRPLGDQGWCFDDWELLVENGALTREELNQLKQEIAENEHDFDAAFRAASGFDPRIHAEPNIDYGDWGGSDRAAGGYAVDGDRGKADHLDRF